MALKEENKTFNFSFCSDTLFKEDFSLREFTERFFEVQNKDKESNLVLSYQCKDEGEHKSKNNMFLTLLNIWSPDFKSIII